MKWRFLRIPDKVVTTIQDLIYYQYAKIIARRAFTAEDGMEAKRGSKGKKELKKEWAIEEYWERFERKVK